MAEGGILLNGVAEILVKNIQNEPSPPAYKNLYLSTPYYKTGTIEYDQTLPIIQIHVTWQSTIANGNNYGGGYTELSTKEDISIAPFTVMYGDNISIPLKTNASANGYPITTFTLGMLAVTCTSKHTNFQLSSSSFVNIGGDERSLTVSANINAEISGS